MMPVKEILAMRPMEPRPPVMVVDETTIKETVDAGPICGCFEKYQMVQNYTPFIPGGVNPYRRRKIPENECFRVFWKQIRLGSWGMSLDKPFANHQNEIPENFTPSKQPPDEEDLMFLQLPRYSEEYFREKLRECEREHVEGCECFAK